ncbi:MAG: hypothetical protein NUK65_10870, partial [Firmicutes bacterium]|nr:hypothetical protein [Bacillota bacterium]
MLKSGKVTACILMVLLLFACETKNTELPKTPNPTPVIDVPTLEEPEQILLGMAVFSPVEIPYFINNPLEIKEIDETESNKHTKQYFQISGLVDKTVENRINHAIKSLYEELQLYTTLQKIPPYRGIARAMPEGELNYDSSISMWPTFNSNNVLSVLAHGSVYSTQPALQTSFDFTVCETLNFDLNTGTLFSLENVFTNDVNSLEIVNTAVLNKINEEPMFSITLAAPFTGISHEQKFYVTNTELHIVLDYNNPEFNIGFHQEIVSLPLYSTEGQIAIAARFYNKDNAIFINKSAEKRLLSPPFLNKSLERDSYQSDGIEWSISLYIPEDMPVQLTEVMKQMRVDKDGSGAYLAQKDPINSIEQKLRGDFIGRYITISNDLFVEQRNGRWERTVHVYTRAGEPVTLKDLFIPGYDYVSLIEDSLAQAFIDHGLENTEKAMITIANLSFEPTDTHLSFTTKTYEWSVGVEHPLNFQIP